MSFQRSTATPASSPIPRPCLKRPNTTRPSRASVSRSPTRNYRGNASISLPTQYDINSNASAHFTHTHVHFPATPLLHSTYPTHSKKIYDRRPVVVLPNVCAMPRRGSPGRRYIGGIEVGGEDEDIEDPDLMSPLQPPSLISDHGISSSESEGSYAFGCGYRTPKEDHEFEDEGDADTEDIVSVLDHIWMEFLPHAPGTGLPRLRSRSRSKSGSRERSGSRDRSGSASLSSSVLSSPEYEALRERDRDRDRGRARRHRERDLERKRCRENDEDGRWKTGISSIAHIGQMGNGFGVGVDDAGCFGGF